MGDFNAFSTVQNIENGDSTYVEWNKLSDKGNELVAYSEKDIKNQIEKIQELRKQVTWEGADAEASLQGFDEFMGEMQKLSVGLSRYGKFLNGAAESYKDTSNKIKNKFENDIYKREAA